MHGHVFGVQIPGRIQISVIIFWEIVPGKGAGSVGKMPGEAKGDPCGRIGRYLGQGLDHRSNVSSVLGRRVGGMVGIDILELTVGESLKEVLLRNCGRDELYGGLVVGVVAAIRVATAAFANSGKSD